MEGKEISGKKVAVFYDDGIGHVSRKDGICSDYEPQEITLDYKIIIQKSRIVRIEVLS